jgi:DNA-directed RNA polymerase specialized sigma24 family protein
MASLGKQAPREWKAFDLYVNQSMPLAEVAETVGIGPDSVGKYVSRFRARAKQELTRVLAGDYPELISWGDRAGDEATLRE